MVVRLEDPAFVVIGGGTGLSVLLRGLKRFTKELTVIVTMADNGGSSGALRREKGMLPPGDIRNCLVALANTEPAMEKLLQYRYKDGTLEGQNFGNLLIAVLNDIYGDFEEALLQLSNVLQVTGHVLPVTTEHIELRGHFADGNTLVGESEIPSYAIKNETKIEQIELEPKIVMANEDCFEPIEQAQLVVLGPGSLYTSIIPNLLVDGIAESICNSQAKVVYIANIMTQRGETDGLTLLDHIYALERHGLRDHIDTILVNQEPISESLREKYFSKDGTKQLFLSEEEEEILEEKGIEVEFGEFLDETAGVIRHNALTVSQRLLALGDEI